MMKKKEDDSRSEKAEKIRNSKVENAQAQADKAQAQTDMAKLEKHAAQNPKAKEIGEKNVQHAKTMADFKTKLRNQQRNKLKAEQAKEDAKKTAEKQEATKAAAKAAHAKRLKAACVKTCPTQCKPAASRSLLGELLELSDNEPTFKDADSIMRRAHQKVTKLREDEDEYKKKTHELHRKILEHDHNEATKALDKKLQVAKDRFKQHKKQAEAKIAQQAAKIKATADQTKHHMSQEKESKKVLQTKLCEVKCEKQC